MSAASLDSLFRCGNGATTKVREGADADKINTRTLPEARARAHGTIAARTRAGESAKPKQASGNRRAQLPSRGPHRRPERTDERHKEDRGKFENESAAAARWERKIGGASGNPLHARFQRRAKEESEKRSMVDSATEDMSATETAQHENHSRVYTTHISDKHHPRGRGEGAWETGETGEKGGSNGAWNRKHMVHSFSAIAAAFMSAWRNSPSRSLVGKATTQITLTLQCRIRVEGPHSLIRPHQGRAAYDGTNEHREDALVRDSDPSSDEIPVLKASIAFSSQRLTTASIEASPPSKCTKCLLDAIFSHRSPTMSPSEQTGGGGGGAARPSKCALREPRNKH